MSEGEKREQVKEEVEKKGVACSFFCAWLGVLKEKKGARLDEKLSPLVREINWTNNCIILSRTKSDEERAFYLQLCAKERLSKRELNRQIDSALFERSMVEQPKLSTVLREIVPTAQ